MNSSAAQQPRVVVIIPAFNREDLLPQALESVLSQTYGDWEAIVVDDASSDGTFEVAEAFSRRDPRVKAIKLERNQGIGGARNIGIRASGGGELLCLLDSDDYWKDNYLERSLAVYDAAQAEGRKVGIVSSNALILTPDGVTGETWFDRNGWIEPVSLDAMIRHNYLLARAIFSRRAWDETGGEFSPECRGSDDYDLWLRIMELGYEALMVREPLAYYRDHPGADSRNHLGRAEAVIVCHGRALERDLVGPRQRRAHRAQRRHFRALRDRELVRKAVEERRPVRASALALRAGPRGLLAFAQSPWRWAEWASELLRAPRVGRS